MPRNERWAATAALLPQEERYTKEQPFWRAVVEHFGWRRVLDTGCGAGFHIQLLRSLGVEVIGFDLALSAIVALYQKSVLLADLLAEPFRTGAFDAALSLGNTISLLASRREQSVALAELARVVKPGGTVMVQGEDVSRVVSDGPTLRLRTISDSRVHVRIFLRRGHKIEMHAGIAQPGVDTHLETTKLLPTNPAILTRLARPLGLAPIPIPYPPPSGPSTFWLALQKAKK